MRTRNRNSSAVFASKDAETRGTLSKMGHKGNFEAFCGEGLVLVLADLIRPVLLFLHDRECDPGQAQTRRPPSRAAA